MELIDFGRFALSLAFVLALICGVAWVVKRTGLDRRLQGTVKGKRLEVVESLALDTRHRLLLIRRDNREHLLLIGGGQPITVETGIEKDDHGTT